MVVRSKRSLLPALGLLVALAAFASPAAAAGHFVRHASPSVLFFQNGRTDGVIAEASARRLHDAASDPKVVMWYDSGHDPTPGAPDVWCDQAKWLQEWLEISFSAVEECQQV